MTELERICDCSSEITDKEDITLKPGERARLLKPGALQGMQDSLAEHVKEFKGSQIEDRLNRLLAGKTKFPGEQPR